MWGQTVYLFLNKNVNVYKSVKKHKQRAYLWHFYIGRPHGHHVGIE